MFDIDIGGKRNLVGEGVFSENTGEPQSLVQFMAITGPDKHHGQWS